MRARRRHGMGEDGGEGERERGGARRRRHRDEEEGEGEGRGVGGDVTSSSSRAEGGTREGEATVAHPLGKWSRRRRGDCSVAVVGVVVVATSLLRARTG